MLDLSEVTDVTVLSRLDDALVGDRTADSRRLLLAVRKCAERFSFSETRTYPRPDHPDPKKRRSILFLFCGIIVSLRTTLENEQLAMSRLMEEVEGDDELLSLSENRIRDLIRVAGMAETKAKRIHAGLRMLREIDGGPDSLSLMPKSDARDFLLKIPGVGPKAADCLLTIGLGMPSMVVDVNVFRAASWILDGRVSDLNYSDSKAVGIMKSRLDKLLEGEDAFLFQIVHTELLLLSKSMGRLGHRPDKCIGAEACVACRAALMGVNQHTLF